MTVVFPIHNGDADLAVWHAKWLNRLGTWKASAVIAHDPSLNRDMLKAFGDLLRKSFPKVSDFTYPRPRAEAWPQAPNWAWQATARHMVTSGPWLWMEADAVALTKDWVDRIRDEYHASAMPFMGPKVKDMGHINGVAVYTNRTPELLPSAMRATDMAWDYVAKDEMAHRTKDASDLMQHLWSVDGEQWLECGGGQVPMLITAEAAKKNINPKAVMIHRIKDTSLIRLLMEGQL